MDQPVNGQTSQASLSVPFWNFLPRSSPPPAIRVSDNNVYLAALPLIGQVNEPHNLCYKGTLCWKETKRASPTRNHTTDTRSQCLSPSDQLKQRTRPNGSTCGTAKGHTSSSTRHSMSSRMRPLKQPSRDSSIRRSLCTVWWQWMTRGN